MTREEAEIYAKTMTYEDALHNLSRARAIPYRKATLIKVNELIKALSQEPTDDKCHYCEHTYTPYKGNTGEFEQEPCDDEDDGWIDDEYGRSIRLEQNKTETIPPLEPCDDAISINSMVETIATKVTEDTEKFIFETITPYCEEITKREISKKDLERALTQYFSKEPCDDAISQKENSL